MKQLLIAVLITSTALVNGQKASLKALYERNDTIENFRKLVYYNNVAPKWINNSTCMYSVNTPSGTVYYLWQAKKAQKSLMFDTNKLARLLSKEMNESVSPFNLAITSVEVDSGLKQVDFVFRGYHWAFKLIGSDLKKGEKVKDKSAPAKYWAESDEEDSSRMVPSPDGQKLAYIREYNVWVKDKSGKNETQLSFDGSAGDGYSSQIKWSPDGKKFVTNKIRLNTKHYIWFIESSPSGQVQPKLQKREYLKPGDALPVKRPSLFDVVHNKQITVDTQLFENQFDITNIVWRKDNAAFTFEFNQRGHQRYQVVSVNAETGITKVLIDEISSTFIDYSGKKFRYDLNDGSDIVWSSERSGYNHFYLIDAKTGNVKNPITQGNWVVRGIVEVNDKERWMIFKGSGKNIGEDPYFIHYYKVNLDGTGLRDLTPGNANHTAWFSPDYKYLIDSYSRVDLPTVTVSIGVEPEAKGVVLESTDASAFDAKGIKMPEVFTAKGRDGVTDIWGVIVRPSDFDASKQYPVIEYIYAGPHGSFVPKSYSPVQRYLTDMAEMGFIVVQIDGMGTSNRSKAFHDVCWKNLKDAGFPDRIKWIKAAAEKYPEIDTARVGIYGCSAGGQNALAAMLFHGDFYKSCYSACGCHDNRMDKIWWNEQWMGYPVGKAYEECSNVVNAEKLQGKLMLLVGEVDDNVDPASTMQVANALIRAKKEFELVVIPGSNHTMGGDYGKRKRIDFFLRTLKGESIPEWNR